VVELQSSRVGIGLRDIEERFGVSRRTAQRMRDAVRQLFPALEEWTAEDGIVRWRLPRQTAPGLIRWESKDLAALDTAAQFAREAGREEQARALALIGERLRAQLDDRTSCRLAPDVEALVMAEGLAMRPGPSCRVDPEVIAVVREAILACRCVRIDYRQSRSGRPLRRTLHPYGFLYGNRPYMVAWAPAGSHFRIVQLGSVDRIELLPDFFERQEGFDLREFAERSFGVFQEEPRSVVWRFTPAVAEAARSYLFHPSQRFEPQQDGSLLVSFRAGGLHEMAFHVFTWGGSLEVLEPKELRELLCEMAAEVLDTHSED
jgi:predicted DNA-binding transcriptional regulator YafY